VSYLFIDFALKTSKRHIEYRNIIGIIVLWWEWGWGWRWRWEAYYIGSEV